MIDKGFGNLVFKLLMVTRIWKLNKFHGRFFFGGDK